MPVSLFFQQHFLVQLSQALSWKQYFLRQGITLTPNYSQEAVWVRFTCFRERELSSMILIMSLALRAQEEVLDQFAQLLSQKAKEEWNWWHWMMRWGSPKLLLWVPLFPLRHILSTDIFAKIKNGYNMKTPFHLSKQAVFYTLHIAYLNSK